MEFQRFSKIINTYKQKEIDTAKTLVDEPFWIVTEKVHGANLSFWTDGIDVKVASRNQFVDDTFCGAGEVFEKYKPLVLDLFSHGLFSLKKGKDTLTVFGELYGRGVQKEIDYGEGKDFIAFDMMVNSEYVDYFFFAMPSDMLDDVGIPVIPAKQYDSLENALAHPNDEPTKLSNSGDTMEGTVIRPAKNTYFHNGKRVMFKNKNEKFTEKKAKTVTIKQPLTEEEQNLFDRIISYINENRVANVISKMGTITSKDFGTIMKSTMDDIREEFMDDWTQDFTKRDEWDQIKKTVNRELSNTVRKEFVHRIE